MSNLASMQRVFEQMAHDLTEQDYAVDHPEAVGEFLQMFLLLEARGMGEKLQCPSCKSWTSPEVIRVQG